MKLKFLFIPVVSLAACKAPVQETALRKDLASPLAGTWRLISAVTVTKGDSVPTYPVKGQEMIKVINDSHFTFVRHDIKGGGSKPIFDSGAGTYKLDGDNYTEHLQYCNYREWENHDFNFKVSFKGDTLVQKGVEKIDSLKIDHEIIETYIKLNK